MSTRNNRRWFFLFVFTIAGLVMVYTLIEILPQASLWIASVSWNL